MTQPDDDKIDPQNLQATREALARSDTSQSPASQGTGTGTGSAGPVERGPAETMRDVVQGDQGGAPQTAGAAGVSSGLQPGGMKPTTGAGGRGDVHGNIRTPGGSGGEKA